MDIVDPEGDEVSVLCVDADAEAARATASTLEGAREDLRSGPETSADAALERIGTGGVDGVVSGGTLADATGVDFLRWVRDEFPDVPFVLLVEGDGRTSADAAIEAGVTDYFRRDDIGGAALADRIVAAIERVRDERDRRRDQDLRTRAMDEARIGISIADHRRPDTPLVYVNEGFERATGYDAAEAIGRNCRFLQGEETDPEAVATLHEAVETGSPASTDIRNYRADGTAFWNHVDVTPIRDEDGEVTHFLGFQRDITERKRLERELQRTERAVSELYEAATPEAPLEERLGRTLEVGCDRLGVDLGFVNRIGEDTQTVVVSQGSHPLLQAGERAPRSKSYCRRTVETDGLLGVRDAVEEGWADDPAYEMFELACYLGGEVTIGDEAYGTLCFADTEARQEPFTDQELVFVELLTQWVSYELERDRHGREIRRQRDRLEEFAGVVSHDLRNPLNVATGRLDIARETRDDEHLDAVADALDRMEELIEQVLTLSREGRSVDETTAVSPTAVARRARESTDLGSEALVVDGGESRILADEERLQTVFENLFRNAIEHGGADVTVRVGTVESGFYVEDDGTGIPEEERDRVFDSGHTTDEDGTGFGLSIVEQIAEAHGWSVEATDGRHGGARFEVTGVEYA